jgi:type IV pilus assembly protein PilE
MMRNPCKRQCGFTLIELLIALAITGILSSLAVPSYASYMTKTHRLEAKVHLQALMLRQEQWRSDRPAYAENTADLRAPTLQRYRLSIRDADASGYTLVATAIGPQAHDRPCALLMIVVRAGDVQYRHEGTAPAGQCWGL